MLNSYDFLINYRTSTNPFLPKCGDNGSLVHILDFHKLSTKINIAYQSIAQFKLRGTKDN